MIEAKRSEVEKLYTNEQAIAAYEQEIAEAIKQVERVIEALTSLGIKKTSVNGTDFEAIAEKHLTEQAYPAAKADVVASLRGLSAEYDYYQRQLSALQRMPNSETKLKGVRVRKGKADVCPDRLKTIIEQATTYILKDSVNAKALGYAEDLLKALQSLNEALANSGKQRIPAFNVTQLASFIICKDLSDQTLKSLQLNKGFFGHDPRREGSLKIVD